MGPQDLYDNVPARVSFSPSIPHGCTSKFCLGSLLGTLKQSPVQLASCSHMVIMEQLRSFAKRCEPVHKVNFYIHTCAFGNWVGYKLKQ